MDRFSWMRSAMVGIFTGVLWSGGGVASGQAMSSLGWIAESLLTPDEQTRYTQGTRLRRLESQWAVASAANRKEAVVQIQGAVRGYFAGRAKEVSQGLDRAVGILEGHTLRDPDRMLADAVDVVPVPALADPDLTASLRLTTAYPVKARPGTLVLRVAVSGRVTSGGLVAVEPIASRLGAKPKGMADLDLPRSLYPASVHGLASGAKMMDRSQAALEWKWMPRIQETVSVPLDLKDLLVRGQGHPQDPTDLVLQLQIGTEEGVLLRQWGAILSVVPDRDRALAELEELQVRLTRNKPGSVVAETVRHHRFVLGKLASGPPRETDWPAAGVLSGLLQAGRSKESAIGLEDLVHRVPAGSLTVATNGLGLTPGLVRVGGAVDRYGDGVAPVIVAIHGAGGSENMFHDAYGLGALAAECKRRGWILLTPRIHSPSDDIWARIGPVLDPVRHGPVVLLGHSMGSLASVEAARQSHRSRQLAGVVAISVGSRDDLSALKGLPVLVAAGRDDFGRYSSRAMFERLKSVGARAEWLETQSEHLMVVADALPTAVRWIAQLAAVKSADSPRKE